MSTATAQKSATISLAITPGNVEAVLKTDPRHTMTFLDLEKHFGSRTDLMRLLGVMQDRLGKVAFNRGWRSHEDLVVKWIG